MKTILATIFVSVISTGLCIKCFQCNSAENQTCFDLDKNDTKSPFYKECTGNYEQHEPFCRKSAYTILGEKPESRVVRSCGWLLEYNENRKDKCKKGDTDFILKKNCQCFSDACNSASKSKPRNILVAIILLLITCLNNVLN